MDCNTPGFPVLLHLSELTQTNVHWVSNAIQPSHALLSPSTAFNLSQHQCLFQWVCSLHQVTKVLKLQLQHPFNEYSGLISFRIDWFDILAVQGTLKSLLQHPLHICFSRVRLCATPWTAAHQAPLSTGFSRQEYWSGLPFPSPIRRHQFFSAQHSLWANSQIHTWLLEKPWLWLHRPLSAK